jgi:hypothetical protein
VPACILVESLDGKSLHRTRARAQRLVDAKTHVWTGPHAVREIKATPQQRHSASSDYARFLLPAFNFAYPDNLTCMDALFQSAMRYPVKMAKDQRSNPYAEYVDVF